MLRTFHVLVPCGKQAIASEAYFSMRTIFPGTRISTKDKTVMKPSYFYIGNSYTDKTASL